MRSHRYLTRFIALLFFLIVIFFISAVLVAGQEATPGSGPRAPQADYAIYMPLMQKNSTTIYGRVTDDGVPAPNVEVALRLYDGGVWSQIMSTTTKGDGYFFFAGANSLLPGQKYEVRYRNPGNDPTRLWTWETPELTSYTSRNTVNIGTFDIANLELAAPKHLSLVTLPQTFNWTPRPASPTESYEFDLFDYNDSIPSFSIASLGHVSSYNLTSLPAGFLNCIPYAWGLTIHSLDGGRGMPYWYNAVTFYTAAPSGIHGCVADSGFPSNGLQVELYRLNTSTLDPPTLLETKITNASGYFAFTGKPALTTNQVYYVKYPNKEGNPARLYVWYTQPIFTYAASSSVHIGDFDTANVTLLLPSDGSSVDLPRTFTWTPRPGLQADSYELNLYQDCQGCVAWWSDPLGYVGQYILTGLPSGFNLHTQYRWVIWTDSPYDNGYGISYQSRRVTFSSTAVSAESTGSLSEAQRQEPGFQRLLRSLQAEPQAQPGLHPDFEQQPGLP